MRLVRAAGCIFVRVDRSPGRVILLCREAWLALHLPVFVCSPRYLHSELQTDEDFTEWASSSLRSVLCQTCSSLRVRPDPRSGMTYSYWDIKNKSALAATAPRIKVRPIVSHCCHPCRSVLSIAGRALALLVEVATAAVQHMYPLHIPMWRLHAGSLAWVTLLCSRADIVGCAEFDVEDCFLNTPRQMVLQALDFWLGFNSSRTRQQPWFAISKRWQASGLPGSAMLAALLGAEHHPAASACSLGNGMQRFLQSGDRIRCWAGADSVPRAFHWGPFFFSAG